MLVGLVHDVSKDCRDSGFFDLRGSACFGKRFAHSLNIGVDI